jgi:hypothetical protein
MDSYREHPSDFDPSSSIEAEVEASHDVAAAIGTDERRMHVRAYNHWVSLLGGRDFPSIEDLEPKNVADFSDHSVLLDFTCGRDNPALPYIGSAIRAECELDEDTSTIDDVPSRSLLSRLTDHYMQIIANRAPIGFEAEFANPRGETLCYRGILMPFSSDGEMIDFIYGVINWKKVDASDDTDESVATASAHAVPDQPLELTDVLKLADEIAEATALDASSALPVEARAAEPDPVQAEPEWIEDVTGAAEPEPAAETAAPVPHFSWQDRPLADADDELAPVELGDDSGLADRLWAARETAEAVKSSEGRTRAALYRALSLAYDFAIAAGQNPEDYAELLEESGVKAQARAPMTPIVKLVFGVDYDKARLTEFTAALSYAQRQNLAQGEFQGFIERQPGGLKALVAAEREARRPEPKTDTKGEVARARLRLSPAISLADVPTEEEFAVVVTRRGPDGRHEPVAVVADEGLVERVIRNAA